MLFAIREALPAIDFSAPIPALLAMSGAACLGYLLGRAVDLLIGDRRG